MFKAVNHRTVVGVVVLVVGLVGALVGGAAGGAPARLEAKVAASLSVTQSTSSTGFAEAGDPIGLGFLVTNTGNATLTGLAVVDTVGGSTVPASCTSSALLPEAQTTCTATYDATAADVAAGSVTSSATASGTDYMPAVVSSSAVKVHVAAATITTAVAAGAPVGLVGSVTVTGSGFPNGPVAVVFCTKATTVPKCKAGSACTVPYSAGGGTVLATTKLKPGTAASVGVQTQSGSTPGLGTSYTVQREAPVVPWLVTQAFDGSCTCGDNVQAKRAGCSYELLREEHMSDQVASDLHFEPPGPGSWNLDPVHFPRPVTLYFAETHPEPFRRGVHEFMAYYGTLIDTMETQYVNGFAYNAMRPAPESEIPQRFARAEAVWEQRVWRDQLNEWDSVAKPTAIKTHRELQSVDAKELSDDGLVAYLTRCREHHSQMMYQHMRFTGSAMLPVGDLLAHLGTWTDVAPAQALAMMRGAAPVSAGASGERDRLIVAITNDPYARALLDSEGDPGKVLEELRAFEGDVGTATSAYLDLVGFRLLDGFDISERYALELPDALVRSIRSSVDGAESSDAGVDALIADIRTKVPDGHRPQFDDLVGEARLMYRLRDERGVFSDIWASGIMRRAVLVAGRRLEGKSRVHDAEHFVDASFEEMCSLVAGKGGPSDDELAQRFANRSARTAKDAPISLGPPAPPPPDPSGLPPGVARVMHAMGIALGEVFGSSSAPHEEKVLHGLAASGGVYEGPARLISGPSEFDRIVQGDVLVTESTSEAFNILLPLLGAIVTDAGGLLSHSAIVAREYGIPGVVGTRDATDRIQDGTRVRVDGDAGEVTGYA